MEHKIRTIADTTIGTTGMTSPVWTQWLATASSTAIDIATLIAAVGGAVLVILRIMLSWREWRNGTNKNTD